MRSHRYRNYKEKQNIQTQKQTRLFREQFHLRKRFITLFRTRLTSPFPTLTPKLTPTLRGTISRTIFLPQTCRITDMSNRLINETSPYLLQHAENPVDWFPWCDEAFEEARSEDKPIFLSIGYSTCHWCHVMAHESFENTEIAKILNDNFVSIKVDCEERPDIDSVYMNVCQTLTGSGGWPLSIFMTADKKPFFAGTYFPPYTKYGAPGFADILSEIAGKWETDRAELLNSANMITEYFKNVPEKQNSVSYDDPTEAAFNIFDNTFDNKYGGFGNAPKFPMPHDLMFLMLYSQKAHNDKALQMAEKTLLQMRGGGIFDHIGGGFSRYSTDRYFLVPHFEKMLYDNVLLIMAYSVAYHIPGRDIYLNTAKKTADYLMREMTSDEGAFYSAQDADSDGVEGKYYTFTPDEIMSVLGEQAGQRFAAAFDITENGNFDGTNIPNLLKSVAFSEDFSDELAKLYEYRRNRTELRTDKKILTAWNGAAIAAMSLLFRICHDEQYLDAVVSAQKFIQENLCDGAKVFTSFSIGKRSDNSFLDDHAYYAAGLIGLYDATLNIHYLDLAESICDEITAAFSDTENSGFFLCAQNSTELFTNPKETYDGALPSGNSVMAYNLVRLHNITNKTKYGDAAEKQLRFMSVQAQNYPAGHSLYLIAKLLHDFPPEHITVVPKKEPVDNIPFPADILIVPESEAYPAINDRTTYYVCNSNVCLPPRNRYEL